LSGLIWQNVIVLHRFVHVEVIVAVLIDVVVGEIVVVVVVVVAVVERWLSGMIVYRYT
jgi:hypothetical protein